MYKRTQNRDFGQVELGHVPGCLLKTTACPTGYRAVRIEQEAHCGNSLRARKIIAGDSAIPEQAC
jgi:hypothetical protein